MALRASVYSKPHKLGPQNHNGDGLLGPNSIIVVYMDPLGKLTTPSIKLETGLRPNSAGIPYTLLLGIEAMGFPTFWLLL